MDRYQPKCSDCAYWLEEPGEGYGECRRYAPKPVTSKIEETIPYWPTTSSDEWCGELRPSVGVKVSYESN